MKKLCLSLIHTLIIISIVSINVLCQEATPVPPVLKSRNIIFIVYLPSIQSQTPQLKALLKQEERPAYTYFKVNIGYSEMSVNDFNYSFNYIGLEVENDFSRTHLGFLSGYSFGYRKDQIHNAELGHYFSFKLLTLKGGKRFYGKIGGGFEWGMPGDMLDRTKFEYHDGNLSKYTHVYLERNFWVPGVKVKKSGVLNPIVELAVGERVGHFIFEEGVRGNFLTFGIERYDLANYGYSSERIRLIVPSAFVSIGIRP